MTVSGSVCAVTHLILQQFNYQHEHMPLYSGRTVQWNGDSMYETQYFSDVPFLVYFLVYVTTVANCANRRDERVLQGAAVGSSLPCNSSAQVVGLLTRDIREPGLFSWVHPRRKRRSGKHGCTQL